MNIFFAVLVRRFQREKRRQIAVSAKVVLGELDNEDFKASKSLSHYTVVNGMVARATAQTVAASSVASRSRQGCQEQPTANNLGSECVFTAPTPLSQTTSERLLENEACATKLQWERQLQKEEQQQREEEAFAREARRKANNYW